MNSAKLTKEEYLTGVKSGKLMHVIDKEDGEIKMIVRDGYYPPEMLNKLLDVETFWARQRKRGKA